MLGYTNKQITTAEMIARQLELAKWVREAKQPIVEQLSQLLMNDWDNRSTMMPTH